MNMLEDWKNTRMKKRLRKNNNYSIHKLLFKEYVSNNKVYIMVVC